MRCAMRTDVGKVRPGNEDSALVLPGAGVFAVADGMGGHNAGEVASRLAVESVQHRLSTKTPSPDALATAIQETNLVVLRRAQSEEQYNGMGTTLTLLWAQKEEVLIGHVGDSRAYLLREGKLTQCTQDHSVVAELIQQGILTPEEARVHPYRNVITRALGTAGYVDVDVHVMELRPGDRFLLCSDGLSGMVSDEDIAVMMGADTIDKAADALLTAALLGGGKDNITLLVLESDGGVSV